MVVRTHDGAVSLLVDEIGDVLEVEEETLVSPPETFRGFAREAVSGVYKLSGRLILYRQDRRPVRSQSAERQSRVQLLKIDSVARPTVRRLEGLESANHPAAA
jgi:chemotaxis signal transduction protein